MADGRVCLVTACDSGFFHQAAAMIRAVRVLVGDEVRIKLIAIGPFPAGQLAWLAREGVEVFEDWARFPRFTGAPLHAVALTCRPYLPLTFPDSPGFIWMDCDIRPLEVAGLRRWMELAGSPDCPVAAVHETEPCYGINKTPRIAANYHLMKNQRIRTVWGPAVEETLRYFNEFNAGLFAMPAGSPVWARYRANLERALTFPFDKMAEQDSLNIAIQETAVLSLPSTYNWLCSLAIPAVVADRGVFTPDETGRRILVAHLTNSGDPIGPPDNNLTFYELYERLGLARPVPKTEDGEAKSP
jgi:hypothetical protein